MEEVAEEESRFYPGKIIRKEIYFRCNGVTCVEWALFDKKSGKRERRLGFMFRWRNNWLYEGEIPGSKLREMGSYRSSVLRANLEDALKILDIKPVD